MLAFSMKFVILMLARGTGKKRCFPCPAFLTKWGTVEEKSFSMPSDAKNGLEIA